MPLNTWNLSLVFGKQPDAGLGGPAPVDAVPTQSHHLAQRLLACAEVCTLTAADYLWLGFLVLYYNVSYISKCFLNLLLTEPCR